MKFESEWHDKQSLALCSGEHSRERLRTNRAPIWRSVVWESGQVSREPFTVITHDMPEGECPTCGKKMNACTDPESHHSPKPGDIGICVDCHNIHVFAEDMTRRHPTEDELDQIDLEQLSRYQRHLRKLKEQA